MALCTIEEVKDFGKLVNVSSDTEDEIERLIDAVGSLFDKYCNRTLESATFTEYFNGDGSDCLFPKNYPIASVTSLHDDPDRSYGASTLIAAADYSIIDDIYIQLHDSTFTKDVTNIKLVYVAGYTVGTDMPEDIIQACIEQVLWLFKKGEGHRLGTTAKTQGDTTISFRPDALLPEVKMVLNLYRKRMI